MPLNDVPQATQTLGQTQAPIRTNFQNIAAAFPVDHVDYTLAGQGKHNKSTYPRQAPDPVTVGTDMAIFSHLSAATGNTELCIERPAGGPVYEFTSSNWVANDGWTILPSGIILKWGFLPAPATGLKNFIFPVAPAPIPAFTNCYTVTITTQYLGNTDVPPTAFARLISWGPLGFNVYMSTRSAIGAGTGGFTYFAIGN